MVFIWWKIFSIHIYFTTTRENKQVFFEKNCLKVKKIPRVAFFAPLCELSGAVLTKISPKGDEKMKDHTTHDEDLLDEVYKSVTMGSDSVSTLIGKTTDASMREALTAQLEGYQNFAATTRTKMLEKNFKVKESSVFTKIPAEVTMNVTTMMDNSNTKIAEMMINGSTMGIIELTRKIRRTPEASDDCVKIATDVVAFEENNVSKMKTYL